MEIRPLESRDFAVILGWFPNEAALVQWGGPQVRYPLDAAQLERMVQEGRDEPPRRLLWVAETDGQVVAHAQVALDWRHGVGRLGRVGIAPSYRGRGLAVPFLERVVEAFFGHPEFERLELNVYTFNEPAIKTYRQLGFAQEGVRRSAVRVGDARWDTAIFALLRNERSERGTIPSRASAREM